MDQPQRKWVELDFCTRIKRVIFWICNFASLYFYVFFFFSGSPRNLTIGPIISKRLSEPTTDVPRSSVIPSARCPSFWNEHHCGQLKVCSLDKTALEKGVQQTFSTLYLCFFSVSCATVLSAAVPCFRVVNFGRPNEMKKITNKKVIKIINIKSKAIAMKSFRRRILKKIWND